jgi:hypothetical protein
MGVVSRLSCAAALIAALACVPALIHAEPSLFFQGKTITLYVGAAPDLPDVPASIELGKTKAERDVLAFFINNSTIGRAYAAPPGLAPDVLATLRRAFDDTMTDAQFLADCRASKLDVKPRPGEDLQDIVGRMVAINPDTRAFVREIVGAGL